MAELIESASATAWLRSRICSGRPAQAEPPAVIPPPIGRLTLHSETTGLCFCNGEGSPDVGGRGHSYMWTTLHDVKGVEPTALFDCAIDRANMQHRCCAQCPSQPSEVLENVFRHAQCAQIGAHWAAQAYPMTAAVSSSQWQTMAVASALLGSQPQLAVPRRMRQQFALLTKSTSSSPQGGMALALYHAPDRVTEPRSVVHLSGNGDYYSRKEGTHYPDARICRHGTVSGS